MLPERHYIDDAKWIREQLSKLPVAYMRQACDAYSEVYQQSWDDEPSEIRKEHSARFNANTRLREFVKRVLAYVNSGGAQ